MDTKDKAAEALRLAQTLNNRQGCEDEAADMLREYAALLQAQPVACLVENESAIMTWPITCLDEARTYCDEGEEPVLLYKVKIVHPEYQFYRNDAYALWRSLGDALGILPKEKP